MGFFSAILGNDAKKAFEGAAAAARQGAAQYAGYANRGIDEQRASLGRALQYLFPVAERGNEAGEALAGISGVGGDARGFYDALMASPAVQARLDLGTQAIDRSANARGRLYSGATMKAQNRYGQQVATDEMDKIRSTLMQLFGRGAQAGSQSAGLETATGGNISNLLASIGDAYRGGTTQAGQLMASGKIAKSNALNNLFSQGLNIGAAFI